MENKPYKLRAKVGISEFEAEGPVEIVKQDYKDFLAAVSNVSAGVKGTASDSKENSQVKGNSTSTITNGAGFDSSLLKRVFAESGSVVSLLALPKTENADADAVLILIYGYHALGQDYPVTGVRLMQACKQSGLHQVERLERTLEVHTNFVLAAGARRGRRYSLNNQGVAKAQQLITEIVG